MEEREVYIIEKAGELFKKYGIKSVSMDDIAQHLAISKKTLYNYFCDKAELVKKVVREYNCKNDIRFDEVINQKLNAIDKLLEVSRYLIEMLKEINPVIMYDLRKYYPELMKELVDDRRDHIFENIKSNIEKGISEGLYRDDMDIDIIATIYVSRMEGAIFEGKSFKIEYDQAKYFKEFFTYHIRGIASAKGIKYFENKIKNEVLI